MRKLNQNKEEIEITMIYDSSNVIFYSKGPIYRDFPFMSLEFTAQEFCSLMDIKKLEPGMFDKEHEERFRIISDMLKKNYSISKKELADAIIRYNREEKLKKLNDKSNDNINLQ